MRAALDIGTKLNDATRRGAFAKELDEYRKKIQPAFDAAKTATETQLKKKVDEITNELADNAAKVKRTKATITPPVALQDWDHERVRYELAIEDVKKTMSLEAIDPDTVFGNRDVLDIGVY